MGGICPMIFILECTQSSTLIIHIIWILRHVHTVLVHVHVLCFYSLLLFQGSCLCPPSGYLHRLGYLLMLCVSLQNIILSQFFVRLNAEFPISLICWRACLVLNCYSLLLSFELYYFNHGLINSRLITGIFHIKKDSLDVQPSAGFTLQVRLRRPCFLVGGFML